MTISKSILAAVLLCTAASSWSGPATDSLVNCVGDNTTGRDRKMLMRWLFAGIASHPDMADLANVTPPVREEADKAAAQVVSRVLAESCKREARHAVKVDGHESVGKAFEFLGRLAMQEMAANAEVRSSMTNFHKFVDRKKLDDALRAD